MCLASACGREQVDVHRSSVHPSSGHPSCRLGLCSLSHLEAALAAPGCSCSRRSRFCDIPAPCSPESRLTRAVRSSRAAGSGVRSAPSRRAISRVAFAGGVAAAVVARSGGAVAGVVLCAPSAPRAPCSSPAASTPLARRRSRLPARRGISHQPSAALSHQELQRRAHVRKGAACAALLQPRRQPQQARELPRRVDDRPAPGAGPRARHLGLRHRRPRERKVIYESCFLQVTGRGQPQVAQLVRQQRPRHRHRLNLVFQPARHRADGPREGAHR
jgi:hypothetical protein